MKDFIEYKMKARHIKQAQMAKAFCVETRTWRYWMEKPGERLSVERLREIGYILELTDAEIAELVRRG